MSEIKSETQQYRERFERACEMLNAGVKILKYHGETDVYGVKSSDGEKIYKVTPKECRCPDFIRRQKPCKHQILICLHLGMVTPSPVEQDEESDMKSDVRATAKSKTRLEYDP